MKFIMELDAKEVAHLSKKGILEAIIQTLTPDINVEKEDAKPKKKATKKAEVKEAKKDISEDTETEDTPKITTEKVRELMVAKVKGGKKTEAKEILNKYAESLSQVTSEDLQALYDELKVL